ncbi:hypothetical protein DLM77_15730 [Leptospira yasudae]|uniref:Porin n=1 Tax=Leptospira yasudae TaxID=2202201 RepID=A0ABX9M1F9_9LEPT|nr:hypothetical protein DLM77_15730 [Leptospira yasudae]
MFFRAKTKFLAQILLIGLAGFGGVGSLPASENKSEAASEILTHQAEVNRVLLEPVASKFELDQLDFSISNAKLVAQKEIRKSTSKSTPDFGSDKNGITANLSASEFHFLTFRSNVGCRAVVQSNPSQNSFKEVPTFVFTATDFSHSFSPENFLSSLSEHSSTLSSISIFSVGCLAGVFSSKRSICSEAEFAFRDFFDRVRTFAGVNVTQVVFAGRNSGARENRGQWQAWKWARISADWVGIRGMSELQGLSKRIFGAQRNGGHSVISGSFRSDLKISDDLRRILPLIRMQSQQSANVGIHGKTAAPSGAIQMAFILERQRLVENLYLQNNEILSGGLSTNDNIRKLKLSFQLRPNFSAEIRS